MEQAGITDERERRRKTTGNQFYPRPVLCVRSVEESLQYYCERLGFVRRWAHPDGKAVIAQVRRDGLDVILDSGSVIPRAAVPSVLSVSVSDLGSLYREFERKKATICSVPAPVSWQPGIHQFVIEDPDKNILVF